MAEAIGATRRLCPARFNAVSEAPGRRRACSPGVELAAQFEAGEALDPDILAGLRDCRLDELAHGH